MDRDFDRCMTYAPGWGDDAVAMMSARTAAERAELLVGELRAGMIVLDVGCGPGGISAGLAAEVRPGGRLLGIDVEASQVRAARHRARDRGLDNALFAAASAYALPLADRSVDVYFSHALYEHLAEPGWALAQARRVLRPGGLLAVTASDWSRARFDPFTADVELAMAAHHDVRRRAGGDPFAGRQLAGWVHHAGFSVTARRDAHRPDLSYRQLAAYVEVRLAAAARTDPSDEQLRRAVAAAARWGRTDGSVTQLWVQLLAQ